MKKEKKSGEKNVLLKEAILDIDKELIRLNKDKSSLKRQISGIDVNVGDAQKLEKELQERIARLLEKEAGLIERKKNTQVKIDRLSDKLGKIGKIKLEMADV